MALQHKTGPYQGKSGNYQKPWQNNQNRPQQNQNTNYYRPSPGGNFAAYDEDDDIDPEWNDFDPEKTTGNFFGREIPDEVKIRQDVEAQRERWGGGNRNAVIDEEDEFDAMFAEEMGEAKANAPKQIGSRDTV